MKTHPLLALLLAASTLGACETIDPLLPAPPPEELDLWDDSAAGVADPALAKLAEDFWDAELRHDPFRATYIGDPRWNGEIPDESLESRNAWRIQLEAFLDRLRPIEAQPLGPEDRLTVRCLRAVIEEGIAKVDVGLEDWVVDPIEGPHLRMLNVAAVQPYRTARERTQLVERWEVLDSYVRQAGRNLERGRISGRVASRTAIEKVLAQVEALIATPPVETTLLTAATGGGRWVPLPAGGNLAAIAHEHLGDAREQGVLMRLNRHLLETERTAKGTWVLLPTAGDPLSIEERGAFVYDVLRAAEVEIWPALQQYRDVLATRILPVAREDDRAGMVHLPDGLARYRKLIRVHTTLPSDECDPKAIHEYGLAEVGRIRGEIAALGQKVLGTADVATIQAKLRFDPKLHFTTRDEVEAKAREALVRARGGLRGFFGIVPSTRCEVLPVPAYEEADSTIAYYREPAADGSRPGRYYVNTSTPEKRPRYDAEVLAFHEAIPGHHLQIAIAQERDALPRFRRHDGPTAYAEGWALYTERLCDEMGLYSGDLDRLGMLSFDAWRAARLVVDTGIHAMGWTRDDAIDYLVANTLLALDNVENEVDRYIAWPGQALGYKLGQREIVALRDMARERLGAGFRYPDFHDRVLENGAVPLSVLRMVVQDWAGLGAGEPIEAGIAEE